MNLNEKLDARPHGELSPFNISQLNYIRGYLMGVAEGCTNTKTKEALQKPIDMLEDILEVKE